MAVKAAGGGGTIKISATPNEINKNTQPVQLHARQVE